MKSPTQLYKQLIEASFTEKQAYVLVRVLQELKLAEDGTPGSELDTLEKFIEAKDFKPFQIVMAGGSTMTITKPSQFRFNRFGSPVVSDLGDGKIYILNADNIDAVKVLNEKPDEVKPDPSS